MHNLLKANCNVTISRPLKQNYIILILPFGRPSCTYVYITQDASKLPDDILIEHTSEY